MGIKNISHITIKNTITKENSLEGLPFYKMPNFNIQQYLKIPSSIVTRNHIFNGGIVNYKYEQMVENLKNIFSNRMDYDTYDYFLKHTSMYEDGLKFKTYKTSFNQSKTNYLISVGLLRKQGKGYSLTPLGKQIYTHDREFEGLFPIGLMEKQKLVPSKDKVFGNRAVLINNLFGLKMLTNMNYDDVKNEYTGYSVLEISPFLEEKEYFIKKIISDKKDIFFQTEVFQRLLNELERIKEPKVEIKPYAYNPKFNNYEVVLKHPDDNKYITGHIPVAWYNHFYKKHDGDIKILITPDDIYKQDINILDHKSTAIIVTGYDNRVVGILNNFRLDGWRGDRKKEVYKVIEDFYNQGYFTMGQTLDIK